MRFFNGLLIIILFALQLRLWVGEGSVGHIASLNQKIESQQLLNEESEQRNQRLAADVISFQQGHDSTEEYARSQLGMIKPGETFFLVVN